MIFEFETTPRNRHFLEEDLEFKNFSSGREKYSKLNHSSRDAIIPKNPRKKRNL
jgi:hypothetical protein